MTRFCTYFDGAYAPRALAMMRSLVREHPSAEVDALALDAQAAAIARLAPRGTRVVALEDLLRVDPALAAECSGDVARRGWLMEVKPSWLAFALARAADGESLTYVDADLWFLGSPAEAIAESAAHAVALSPSRRTHVKANGARFNAGWIGLRNEPRARAFLAAWRRDCAGRMTEHYTNQVFLERAFREFDGVGELRHPGVNVASWNVAGVELREYAGRLLADGRPLVAYHMTRLLPVAFRRCVAPLRGPALGELLRDRIYQPYLQELGAAARDLGIPRALALDRVEWPRSSGTRWKQRLRLWRRLLRGEGLRY